MQLESIRYINSKGVVVEFTNTTPLILQKFEEVTNTNIYNSKGMRQDGSTYLGNTLSEKDLNLQIKVVEKDSFMLDRTKKRIYEVFNPKLGEGTLIYKDRFKERRIKCIPSDLPYFDADTPSIETCLINLVAHDPYWKDIEETTEEIALWVGTFSFPLEIEEEIELGYREGSLIVNVNNQGDHETGMKIEFKALATLENPSLLNINTGEFIKINKTMTAGEVITVTTDFANKDVKSTQNGITTNAFNFIDLDSTFLQLYTGENLFRYDADEGLDNLEVTVSFTPRYLGV